MSKNNVQSMILIALIYAVLNIQKMPAWIYNKLYQYFFIFSFFKQNHALLTYPWFKRKFIQRIQTLLSIINRPFFENTSIDFYQLLYNWKVQIFRKFINCFSLSNCNIVMNDFIWKMSHFIEVTLQCDFSTWSGLFSVWTWSL